MKENIFSYKDGRRLDFINIFYNLLIKGQPVTYKDVLMKCDEPLKEGENVSSHEYYTLLKKAITQDVIKTFDRYGIPYEVTIKGNTSYYQYTGSHHNPLGFLKLRAIIDEREKELGQCISDKKVVEFTYKPFTGSLKNVIVHPHFLNEYNNRCFLFGISEIEGEKSRRKMQFGLDRIKDDIKIVPNKKYIPAEKGEYAFLAHIVGVSSRDLSDDILHVIIRAHNKNAFGRLKTKPLHPSQRTLSYPDYKEGIEYGDFSLDVYQNAELISKILEYGCNIEVLEPECLRTNIAAELKRSLDWYNVGSQK